MPGGLAAPMGAIRGIAPSFAEALEAKIAKSRAAETYKVFQGISGADNVCVGFRVNTLAFGNAEDGDPGGAEGESGTENGIGSGIGKMFSEAMGGSGGISGFHSSLQGAGGPIAREGESGEEAATDADAPPPDPYILWIVTPSPSGDACAVEFAGAEDEAAATFVYRFGGSWDAFRMKLGMALEAIDWKREVIRLTDEELRKPEYDLYRMANDRCEALRFVRGCFAGRAIHRTMESWKKQVKELFG
jgi:hypothetical protein